MDKPLYSELPKPMEDHQVPESSDISRAREVVIIGGGLAGLSAAIYLGRAMRDVLIVDAGESLAHWEPEVQNYLGFETIDGRELLRRGREQALRYGAELVHEEVERVWREGNRFHIQAKKAEFQSCRLLLATGVYHLPPKIPNVDQCVGKSIFFCKDCDGYRVQGKRVIITGANNDGVDYALSLTMFTECVIFLTNGEVPRWDDQHERWLREYEVPVHTEKIKEVGHHDGCVCSVTLANGQKLAADCVFTTRGDVFHNQLARQLGAAVDPHGQVLVDGEQRTNIPGLYAAGCVTPANCQMIITAGDGATAAQAINHDLFEEDLRTGTLREHRRRQVSGGRTGPLFLARN